MASIRVSCSPVRQGVGRVARDRGRGIQLKGSSSRNHLGRQGHQRKRGGPVDGADAGKCEDGEEEWDSMDHLVQTKAAING